MNTTLCSKIKTRSQLLSSFFIFIMQQSKCLVSFIPFTIKIYIDTMTIKKTKQILQISSFVSSEEITIIQKKPNSYIGLFSQLLVFVFCFLLIMMMICTFCEVSFFKCSDQRDTVVLFMKKKIIYRSELCCGFGVDLDLKCVLGENKSQQA